MTVIEGTNAFYLPAPLAVIENDTETAWEGAKKHMVIRPDIAWLVSNLLTTDPAGNTNGHIFGLEDIQANHRTVVQTPLDIGHQPQYVVGYNAEAELLYPKSAGADAPPNDQNEPWPHVEILSAFFKRPFADEFDDLMKAHRQGRSWVSMQCMPDSLTCMTDGGCGKTFSYKGTTHGSYCDELNQPRSKKRLNNPFFIAAGLIIPPMRPGWRGADINEISALVRRHAAEAERVYATVEAACGYLPSGEVEQLMAMLLAGAFGEVPKPAAGGGSMHHDEKPKPKKKMAYGSPFAIQQSSGAGGVSLEAAESAAQTGVIVAFVPPPDIVTSLAAMGNVPETEIHATIVFLGDAADPGDGSPSRIPSGQTFVELATAVAVFSAGAPSLGEVSLSGLGRFALDNGSEVTYASVDAPALPEFRARLVAALEAAGISVDHTHGLSPHISISYGPPGSGPTQMPEGSWMVHEIELWWGGAMRMSFSLADGKVSFVGAGAD